MPLKPADFKGTEGLNEVKSDNSENKHTIQTPKREKGKHRSR
jgi:hypothetical protein